MAGVQRGPRGEKVTILIWQAEEELPREEPHVEAWASAGVRAGSHKSAKDRQNELLAMGARILAIDTVQVK